MNNFTKKQEEIISDKITIKVDDCISRIKGFYVKIISGLGVVILLETGALIWSLAIGTSENNHQNEAIKELSNSINNYVISTNDYMEILTKTTIQNAEKVEANKNRLDRSPY